jgi:hypothetical protein
MQYFWHIRGVKAGFWRDETSTQPDAETYGEWRTGGGPHPAQGRRAVLDQLVEVASRRRVL